MCLFAAREQAGNLIKKLLLPPLLKHINIQPPAPLKLIMLQHVNLQHDNFPTKFPTKWLFAAMNPSIQLRFPTTWLCVYNLTASRNTQASNSSNLYNSFILFSHFLQTISKFSSGNISKFSSGGKCPRYCEKTVCRLWLNSKNKLNWIGLPSCTIHNNTYNRNYECFIS